MKAMIIILFLAVSVTFADEDHNHEQSPDHSQMDMSSMQQMPAPSHSQMNMPSTEQTRTPPAEGRQLELSPDPIPETPKTVRPSERSTRPIPVSVGQKSLKCEEPCESCAHNTKCDQTKGFDTNRDNEKSVGDDRGQERNSGSSTTPQ